MVLDYHKLRVLLCVLVLPLSGAFSSYEVVYIGRGVQVLGQEGHYNSLGEFFANQGVDNFTSIFPLTPHFISPMFTMRASNIEISGVSFLNCGSIQSSTSTDFRDESGSSTLKLKSVLYFHYCMNIRITSATFEDNHGIGVVIYDSSGTVNISDCIFRGNKISPDDREAIGGGGGVHIEITSFAQSSVDIDGSIYQIRNCNFTDNNATTLLVDVSSYSFLRDNRHQGLGRGGGVYAGVGGCASNVEIVISGCNFTNNNAVFGGGVFVVIEKHARGNCVTVKDCNMTKNLASESGGGLYMVYASSSAEMKGIRNNTYIATRITFWKNSATYYGGMSFLNVFKGAGRNNNLRVTGCKWIGNGAVYGAALGVATHSGISYENQSIELDSCSFSKNSIVPKKQTVDNISHSQYRKAVMSVSFEQVIFKGQTIFEDNIGSALWVQTSTVQFLSSAVAYFTNNSGHHGGAIGLVSNSIMLVNTNSSFYFTNNSADVFGGALFLEIHDEQNPYSMSHVLCPLQFEGNHSQRNVCFHFVNNKASVSGNSIYFTTLDSCVYLCTQNTSADLTQDNVFKCIGEVHWDNKKTDEFSTLNYDFQVKSDSSNLVNGTLLAVPGKQFDLPVSIVDQLHHTIDTVFIVKIYEASDIVVDQCVSGSTMIVYGSPESTGVLKLFNRGFLYFSVELNITLLSCPLGYKLINVTMNNNTEVKSCTCTTDLQGIYCGLDANHFNVYLIQGYWAGYLSKNTNFFTGLCPPKFCSYNGTNASNGNYLIPSDKLYEAGQRTDDFVCGPCREGILCGECRQNFSVFFHSPDYRCHPDKLCSLGWLFYIASELLPLMILFISVIFFNISFTSGAINAFVLFAQTIDSLVIYKIRYEESSVIKTFTSIYGVVYSFFNLNFFGIDKLSFCLLKGANALDIIAFKYATVALAIVLIAVTILAMKRCKISQKFLAKISRDGAVTHGLSAFLILCYVQCAQVSMRLLLSSRLYGTMNEISQFHLFYYGKITLFSPAHLPYALPALLCLALIIFPPPIILLWHPLGKRLLSLCGLGESFFVRAIDKVLLVNKLMPVLDSFQSCFKDNCRFFAGLHFIYRLSLFVALPFGHYTQFYVWVLVNNALMLLAHAALQPYQRKLYNVIDSLLFTNLLLINLISLYIDMKIVSHERGKQYALTASIIRLILIYCPLICAFGSFLLFVTRYFWQKISKPVENAADFDISYEVFRSHSEVPLSELKH